MLLSAFFKTKKLSRFLILIIVLLNVSNESFAQSGRKKYQDTGTGKWGFTNYESDIIVKPIYDEIDDFVTLDEYGANQYIAKVKTDNKFGYIDTEGNRITDMVYDNCSDFLVQGYAFVLKSGKQGLIDRFGKVILPIEYDGLTAYPFSGKFRVVATKAGNTFLTDNSANILSAPYNSIYRCKNANDIFITVKDNKKGTIDVDGKEIIKPAYDEIDNTSYFGTVLVKLNNKFGAIDINNGRELLPVQYTDIDSVALKFPAIVNWYESLDPDSFCEEMLKKGVDGSYSFKTFDKSSLIMFNDLSSEMRPTVTFLDNMFSYALGNQAYKYYYYDISNSNDTNDEAALRRYLFKSLTGGDAFPVLLYFPASSNTPYKIIGAESVEELNEKINAFNKDFESQQNTDFPDSLY